MGEVVDFKRRKPSASIMLPSNFPDRVVVSVEVTLRDGQWQAEVSVDDAYGHDVIRAALQCGMSVLQ